jgi:hypothetical protein
VKLDWDAIRNKVQMEFQRELERTRGGGGDQPRISINMKATAGGSGPGSSDFGMSLVPGAPKKGAGSNSHQKNAKKLSGVEVVGKQLPRKPPPPPEEPPDVDVEPQIPVDEDVDEGMGPGELQEEEEEMFN